MDWETYKQQYQASLDHNSEFWAQAAKTHLKWDKEFETVSCGRFEDGTHVWFPDGRLNACYNVVDRHTLATPDKLALIYEADDPADNRTMTYYELLCQVCRLANYLESLSCLRRGSVVTIYMPMIPEAVVAMLACARLGMMHNVVFSGFSSTALSQRISDSGSALVITCDQGVRGGKIHGLKQVVDDAVAGAPSVVHVLVYRRVGNPVQWIDGRDVWWHDAVAAQRPYCPAVSVSGESPLFLLYTSGSTGKPKGVLHTTGGYLLYATITAKYVFDLRVGDVFGCMADIGWITGHSYAVYGPLANGVTSLLFEGTPVHPTASRYWEVVERHRLTQLYMAPTVARMLRALEPGHMGGHDLSSLRVLASVGEPVGSETWNWMSEHIGGSRCTMVDTYWQTETGGVVVSPIPGGMATKAGSVSLPFLGIELAILDFQTGEEIKECNVSGMLAIKRSWPGVARSLCGDHRRYQDAYFGVWGGYFVTGDGGFQDEDGLYHVTGRVDDVVNVSGHRLSTNEVENCLSRHPGCSEVAVLGEPDEITGQSICAFVTLRHSATDAGELKRELGLLLRAEIGAVAKLGRLVVCSELPKTRSGKIMRRILRHIAAEKHRTDTQILSGLGDLSTLSNPDSIPCLIQAARTS